DTYCFTLYFSIRAVVSFFVIGSRSRPIAGSISTIETSAPRGAKYSTTSRPTAPPPITTTCLPDKSSGYTPFSTSLIISKILKAVPPPRFSCKPVIGGRVGTEPVAFTTTSGLNFLTMSTEASTSVKINKFFNFFALLIRYLGKSPKRFLSGNLQISFERPPSSSVFSNKNVVHPTSAAVHAASKPAVPAPITTTLHGFVTLCSLYSSPP